MKGTVPVGGPFDYAWYLIFSSDFFDQNDYGYRLYGFPVRPLRGFAK